MLKAIDVSKYQGVIDWPRVQTDVVLIQAGYRGYEYGNIEIDAHARANMAGAVNIPHKGLYFFSQAITAAEAAEEANWCMALAKECGYTCDAGIWIDCEWSNNDHNGRADWLIPIERTDCAEAFCATVRAAGIVSGIYTSTSWLGPKVDPGGWPVWVADYRGYNGYTGGNVYGWQYTSGGSMDGISGRVDMSEWYQDFAPAVSPLSDVAVRMVCHCTGMDRLTLANDCANLGIDTQVGPDSVLTTVCVTRGDQYTLQVEAANLGIEWAIYTPDPAPTPDPPADTQPTEAAPVRPLTPEQQATVDLIARAEAEAAENARQQRGRTIE